MSAQTTLFDQIQGAKVLLSSKGVLREADVYKYRDRLHAKVSPSGYIALKGNEATSSRSFTWKEINGVDYAAEYNGLRPVVTAPATTKKGKKK